MSRPFITIIGLGRTGASLGLAMRREEADFDIVGHDKEPQRSADARKLGAVDRTDWNLHNAVEGAELVVLAIPVSEVDDTLTHIADDLKPGNVVLACVNSMAPAIAAADARLPEGVHFVAAHPIVTDTMSGAPAAGLFVDTFFCLAPSLQTDPAAISLASDLIERVGAKPLYMDPQEHDGIVAGVELLPQVLAAALMQSASHNPGWTESQRLAGKRFAQASDIGAGADELYAGLMANRAGLLARLDQLTAELTRWRTLLANEPAGDAEQPLLEALHAALDARAEWEQSVKLKRWDDVDMVAEPTENPGMLRQLFFGNLFGSRRPRTVDDKDTTR